MRTEINQGKSERKRERGKGKEKITRINHCLASGIVLLEFVVRFQWFLSSSL